MIWTRELDFSIISTLTLCISSNNARQKQVLRLHNHDHVIKSSVRVILSWTLIRFPEKLYSTGSCLYATPGQKSKKLKKLLDNSWSENHEVWFINSLKIPCDFLQGRSYVWNCWLY